MHQPRPSYLVLPVSLSRAAAKIPVEIILERIYPHSCRLEVVVDQLLPSCDLYFDTDSPSFIKLCSSALVASESPDLLSPDISASQSLASMAIPSSCRLGWNEQAPLESVLCAVSVEVSSRHAFACRSSSIYLVLCSPTQPII